MNKSDEGRPLDQSLKRKLITYADHFEFAVRAGHDIVAATTANAIVQILKRFFPLPLSKFCSAESGPRRRPSFLVSLPRPTSPPDVVFLGVVRPAVTGFKEALAADDVAGAMEALRPTGIIAEEDSPQAELGKLEVQLARKGGTNRLEFLPLVAKLAMWAGETERAEGYAREAVELESPGGPDTNGEGTHDGNMVLGLIALEWGNVERAKQYLLESGRTTGLGYLSLTGPNLSLASELLKRNEREAVIDYLRECRRFWVDGRKILDAWTGKIRNGDDPDFDPLYFTL